MNLAELKEAVDQAMEHAGECGLEASDIPVWIQIDGPKQAQAVVSNQVKLYFDCDVQASGCVLLGCRSKDLKS